MKFNSNVIPTKKSENDLASIQSTRSKNHFILKNGSILVAKDQSKNVPRRWLPN